VYFWLTLAWVKLESNLLSKVELTCAGFSLITAVD